MESLYILIPVALLLIGGAVAAFLWAVNSDQFEDLDTESRRLLFEEEEDDNDTTSPTLQQDRSDD